MDQAVQPRKPKKTLITLLFFVIAFLFVCVVSILIAMWASGYFNSGEGSGDFQENWYNSSTNADFIANVKRHNESCRIQCISKDFTRNGLGVERIPPTRQYCKCPDHSGCCADRNHILKPYGNVTKSWVYKEIDAKYNTRFVNVTISNPLGCECQPRDDLMMRTTQPITEL